MLRKADVINIRTLTGPMHLQYLNTLHEAIKCGNEGDWIDDALYFWRKERETARYNRRAWRRKTK